MNYDRLLAVPALIPVNRFAALLALLFTGSVMLSFGQIMYQILFGD